MIAQCGAWLNIVSSDTRTRLLKYRAAGQKPGLYRVTETTLLSRAFERTANEDGSSTPSPFATFSIKLPPVQSRANHTS
jgi:hypothetical protein